jgi:hypothetical protein
MGCDSSDVLSKYPTLSVVMSGQSHKVIARVIKALSGKKLFGAGSFKRLVSYLEL